MARVVHLARWGYSSVFDQHPDDRAMLRQGVLDVAAGIGERLAQADQCGRQQVRGEFQRIVSAFALDGDHVHFGTANWDGAVDRGLRAMGMQDGAFHFHGHVGSGTPLYLPAETAHEPYRDESHRNDFHECHARLMNTIDRSTKLVLYGISLSALDAELAQILASGMHESKSLREIVIVDPCHRRVAMNLRTMIPRFGPALAITGFHPLDTRAGACADYSVQTRAREP